MITKKELSARCKQTVEIFWTVPKYDTEGTQTLSSLEGRQGHLQNTENKIITYDCKRSNPLVERLKAYEH
jgi:hypothetical protein